MKLDYIHEYLTLTETMNYSIAAEKLFISQPTLSRHIQAMEKELGLTLISTSSHGISLTKAGELAVSSFRKIEREYNRYLDQCTYLTNQVSGKIKIGLLYYAMDDNYAEFIEYIEEKYPNLEITVSCYQPQALWDDLKNGKMDIVSLLWNNKSHYPDIKMQKIGQTGMIALMRKDHPLSSVDSITLQELSFSTLIELKNDDFSNELSREMLRKNKIHFSKVIQSDNIETVPLTIRKYGGIHLTGESCKRQKASSICYKNVVGPYTNLSYGFMALKDNENPLIDLLMQEAKEYFHIGS